MKITKDNLTASNVASFLRAHGNMARRVLLPYASHENVQIELRAYLCKECTEAGMCTVCKCSTPDLYHDFSRVDKKGRWGKILNSKEWGEFISSLPEQSISTEELAKRYTQYYQNKWNNTTEKTKQNTTQVTVVNLPLEMCVKDLGEVELGSKTTVEFEFKNPTEIDIEILGVNSSCHCTVSKVKAETVKPGEIVKFEVSYNANSIGRFIQSVSLLTKQNVILPSFDITGTVVEKLNRKENEK